MKVSLNIALDIPGAEKLSDAELRQLVFDAYVNHATCAHTESVLSALSREPRLLERATPEQAENIKVGTRNLMNYHKTWSEICEQATFEIAR